MLALAIFLVTLLFVIWQPKGLGIGWSALAGAAVALATGVIHLGDIPTVWHIVWDATFTFVALIIISLVLDEAGFFHWAALHIACWGGGRGRRLFPLVVLLGAAIAAFFANDGAALLLTPIVLAILLRLEFKPAAALAFIIACGFVADSTSLPLVISNLVNIVSANYFGIGFGRYAAVMVPVDLVSLTATLIVLWWYFRRDVPAAYAVDQLEAPHEAIRDPLVFKAAFPLLGVLLVAYFVTAPFDVPVSIVTSTGALILLALAGRWLQGGRGGVINLRKVLTGAPWQIVIFSLGMYLVVYGLKNAGLTDYLARGLVWLAGFGPWIATLGTGFAAAILSSVMNNMPSVLVGALSIQQAPDLSPLTRELMVYANVIGCDLGPKFTPIGSLATLLWLHVLASKGQKITWGQYMKVGLVITPPVLFVTLLALTGWVAVLAFINRSTPLSRLRHLSDPDHLPALDRRYALDRPALNLGPLDHPPRILLLYGSLREVSYSRLAVEEAARLLRFFGAEPRIFNPSDLPYPDQVKGDDHPAVHELRELSLWSEGHVWCSPERHGQVSGLLKAQIDHLPLSLGGKRPTQGRTLAVMQVSGGSQSFNTVNSLRLLGRWMRMVTIPNQSSVAKAFSEFEDGRMKASPYYDRIVDVMEELVRFTVLLRPHVAQMTDRYSERKETAEQLSARVNMKAI